jgi:hypothetical protein
MFPENRAWSEITAGTNWQEEVMATTAYGFGKAFNSGDGEKSLRECSPKAA